MKIKLILIIVFFAIILTACAFLNEYSIETIGAYCGKDIDFPFWGAALLAFVPGLGQACIPIAAIVYIVGFFI